MKTALALTALLNLATADAFAETDVSVFDIKGFRLGMAVDEVKKMNSHVLIKEVKPEGKTSIGYLATVGDTKLYFTLDELGKVLFYIRTVHIYNSKPESHSIFSRITKKYGTPDFTGRKMFNIHACWGKCYGKHKRLEFDLKISDIGNRPYPMTLTLSDPELESKNRKLYTKKREQQK